MSGIGCIRTASHTALNRDARFVMVDYFRTITQTSPTCHKLFVIFNPIYRQMDARFRTRNARFLHRKGNHLSGRLHQAARFVGGHRGAVQNALEFIAAQRAQLLLL